jgi:hypothetical protein
LCREYAGNLWLHPESVLTVTFGCRRAYPHKPLHIQRIIFQIWKHVPAYGQRW